MISMPKIDPRGPDGSLYTDFNNVLLYHIFIVICVIRLCIWHQIWNKSIKLILVSKEATGPQKSSPVICLCLEISENPLHSLLFVFWDEMAVKSRHRRNQWSTILFMFMEFPDFIHFWTKVPQFWTTLLNSMLGKLSLY